MKERETKKQREREREKRKEEQLSREKRRTKRMRRRESTGISCKKSYNQINLFLSMGQLMVMFKDKRKIYK